MGNQIKDCLSDEKEVNKELIHINQKQKMKPISFNDSHSNSARSIPKIETKTSLQNGNKITGISNDGVIDEGSIEFVNGDIYTGGIWKGMAHGNGKMSYTNGDYYKGRFANNLREGKGVLKAQNGEFYEGTFKDDKFDGEGLYKFSNGNVYKGWVILILQMSK